MFIDYVTHLVLVLTDETKIAAKLETVFKYARRNRKFKKRVFLYSNSFLSNKSVHCYGIKSNNSLMKTNFSVDFHFLNLRSFVE